MEKIYQSINAEGIHIPLELIREYGLEPGSRVVLHLECVWKEREMRSN